MLSFAARDPRKVYLERFIFMAALLIPSVFLMGLRALLVSVLSVVLCMVTDRVCCLIRKIPYDIKDYAVPFWGLAASMLMPSSISIGLVVMSSVICIGLGKHICGGSDNILFPPPAIAVAFLIICYPAEMLYFTKAGEHYPIFGEFSGTLGRSLEYALKLGNVPIFHFRYSVGERFRSHRFGKYSDNTGVRCLHADKGHKQLLVGAARYRYSMAAGVFLSPP